MTLITNSRLRAYYACQRLHQIRFVQGMRAIGAERGEAGFGTLMHAGLEAWWLWHQVTPTHILPDALNSALTAMRGKRDPSTDDADWEKAHALMCAYDLRWAPTMAEYEVLAVETEFRAPLVNPETLRPMRGVKLAGKLDALVRDRSGGVWIVEHKTTGADLTPGSTYFQRLRMDTQVSMYFAGARRLGYDPVGCLYDVIARPDIRPKMATPPEQRKFTKEGKLYANQRAEDETLDEFAERLTTVITPESFARVEVVRLEQELRAFDADLYAASRQMLAVERTQRGAHAPRNVDACHRQFGRPCEFLSACDGSADLADETLFAKGASVHPELETAR